MAATGDSEIRAAMAALAWWRDAGLDVLLAARPRDRFAETETEKALRRERREAAGAVSPGASRQPPPSPTGAASHPAAPAARDRRAEGTRRLPQPFLGGESAEDGSLAMPDERAIADARERARSAASIEDLRRALEAFDGCNLKRTAASTVFGDGAENADLMLIGEAPGREEDKAGIPFVGRSGQLLNRMLEAIGLERSSVRITNVVPWRPPGNRSPSPAETEICLPFVQRHIELVRPKILVCLGSPSAKAVLDLSEGILRTRGRWTQYSFGLGENETIEATSMLHPAYLLRQPAQKRLAWRDLLALKARLQKNSLGD